MRMLHFGLPSVVRGVRHGLVPLFLPQLQTSCLAAGAGSPLTFCLPRAASPRGVLLACALFFPWRGRLLGLGAESVPAPWAAESCRLHLSHGRVWTGTPVAAVYAACGLCRGRLLGLGAASVPAPWAAESCRLHLSHGRVWTGTAL